MHTDLGSVPKPVAIKAIIETVREFCRTTEILKVQASNITVLLNTAEFTISFTGDYEPVSIDEQDAYLGDGSDTDSKLTVTSKRQLDQGESNWQVLTTASDITHVFLTQSGKARVYPIVETTLTDYLRLKCSVMPTRSATQMVDDLIYNDYIEVIRDGTIARILDMRNTDWYDPVLSREYRRKFIIGMADARTLDSQGKNNHEMYAKVDLIL